MIDYNKFGKAVNIFSDTLGLGLVVRFGSGGRYNSIQHLAEVYAKAVALHLSLQEPAEYGKFTLDPSEEGISLKVQVRGTKTNELEEAVKRAVRVVNAA